MIGFFILDSFLLAFFTRCEFLKGNFMRFTAQIVRFQSLNYDLIRKITGSVDHSIIFV